MESLADVEKLSEVLFVSVLLMYVSSNWSTTVSNSCCESSVL
jgi:hypothetical protein